MRHICVISKRSAQNIEASIMSSPVRNHSTESSTISHLQDNSMQSFSMSDEYEPPRKKRVRAKLDHLSPHEKLARRKMKNRIAAQTARDRKRAKIDHLQEENRKLREENELLKSRLQMSTASDSATPLGESKDSGLCDIYPASENEECVEMDLLNVPAKSLECPQSPGSSTSGAYSASPAPASTDYLDSVVDETDENTIINDIIRLDRSLFSESGNDVSLESAELISVPQQQVQGTQCRSLSEENAVGWTSIQLMLLLIISRAHHLFYSRINCCATAPGNSNGYSRTFGNLYDYIQQTRCINYRRVAEAIISSKSNVRHQKMVALDFLCKFVYNDQLRSNNIHLKSCIK